MQQPLQPIYHNTLPDPAIITKDLLRVFGQKAAVNHLNLVVKRGEFYGFLGPNGAGKSTTIKMMVGLLRPTAGSVLVGGIDVWKDPLQARALMGVLPEYLNLYERLTGKEFLVFAGHMYGLPSNVIKQRSEELLHILTLVDDADKLIVDYCKIREETQQESGLKGSITEVYATVSNRLWRQRGCYVIWNDQRFTI